MSTIRYRTLHKLLVPWTRAFLWKYRRHR